MVDSTRWGDSLTSRLLLPLPRGGWRAISRDASLLVELGRPRIHVFGIQSSSWLLLAEAAKKAADPPARSPGLQDMLPAFAIIAVLFYFLILRPQKSKDQQFRSLVENLKETDRVVTIGGIYGVVTNVQREAGIVTLRVDESTGAKIRVNTSAIARVITDDEKEKKE